jgi:hypothetical protein
VNYGSKLQKDTEIAVDQDLINRGGPGKGNAMKRAGLVDDNGYKPNTPGVNSRDTRSQDAQYDANNTAMADIKRERATAQANGTTWQPKGVNTINPSRRVDISGDRRRLELANGEPKFSRDEDGVNYVGPKKLPAPLAAPTPAPVAKTTQPPAPQGGTFAPGQWNGTPGSGDPFLAKMREQGVIRPDGSLNNQAPAQVAPTGSSLSPEQHDAMAEFQAKNNARMKAEGSTRPPDDYTKLSPGEQKYVYDFNLERGNIPRPVRPPTGQVPNPRNPNKDMNDRPMLPKPPGMAQGNPNIDPTTGNPAENFDISPADFGDMRDPKYADLVQKNDRELGVTAGIFTKPVGPKPMWDDPGSPQGLEPLVRGEQGSLENILKPKPQGVQIPPPPGTRNPSLAPAPQRTPPRPIAPPSSGLKGSTTPRAPAPKPKEPFTIGNFTQAVDENSPPVGPKPPRVTPPAFKEGMTFKSPVMQQFNTPKPVEGVNKMPPIKKSNPITDTIKAANNPVPVAQPNPKQKIQPVRNVIKKIRGR